MATTSIFGMSPVNFDLMVIGLTGKSAAGGFWQIVITLWSGWWPIILVVLFVIVAWELLTRHGTAHYNSRNGFSPDFNRLVGSGVYLLLQAGVYGLIHHFFGDAAYLHSWPYVLHLIVFASTGLLLNLTGFWVYWKPPRF